MTIVHRPIEPEPKKKCSVKPPYYDDGSERYSSVYNRYLSNEPKGTIWECPGCGTYVVTSSRGGTRKWVPVSWYHFAAKRVIRGLDQPGVDKGSTVL